MGNSASGTYVGKASNGAYLVQIVQTDGGHLSGRYEELVLQPEGKVRDLNAGLTGEINDQTIVLTMKPNELLAGSITLSGSLEHGHLHLSGGANGGSMTLDLQRADEASFRMQMAVLNGQAAKIVDYRARFEAAQKRAQAQAERLAQLQALVQRMTTDISKIDAVLPTFGPAETSYRQSTELMRRGLSREQGILGSGQAAVSRSQLAIAINQASIQVDQIHTNWQNNYRNFAASYGQLAPQIRDFEQSCGASPPAVMPAEQDAWKSACARFADIDKPFQDRISSVKTAFGKLENVWADERPQQEQIVQAARSAEG